MQLMVCAAAPVLFGPAAAQVAEQSECWLGSRSFSLEATAQAAGRLVVCSPDFIWKRTSEKV